MELNIVIGNPNYNKDEYLKFLKLGHNIAEDNTCMIVPAKQYFNINRVESEKLWLDLKQYISEVIYYQCEGEVFNICLPSGVAYYLLQKDTINRLRIENKSNKFNAFNNECVEFIKLNIFNIKALRIIEKVIKIREQNTNKNFESLKVENIDISNTYKCSTRKQAYIMGGSSNKSRGMFYYDNTYLKGRIINTLVCDTEISNAHTCIFSSDNKEEVESLISYINTKLIRFILANSISSYSNILINEAFRYIPKLETEELNHLYTDEELYKIYRLTDEDIKSIEEIIK